MQANEDANHPRAKGQTGVGRVPADSQIWPLHAHWKECPRYPQTFPPWWKRAGAAGLQPEASYLLVCWWLSSRAPWRGTVGWCPETWSNPLGSSAGKTPPAPGRRTVEQMLSQRASPQGGRIQFLTWSRPPFWPPWKVTPEYSPWWEAHSPSIQPRPFEGKETTLPKASSPNNQSTSWEIYQIINLPNDQYTKISSPVDAKYLIFIINYNNNKCYLLST